MRSSSFLALVLPLAIGATIQPPPVVLSVNLDSGPVSGVRTDFQHGLGPVDKFLGIPYGAKPERFSMPQKPQPWKKVRASTRYGPTCPQFIVHSNMTTDYNLLYEIFSVHPEESEDCLFVNVFAPLWKGAAGRPIVVAIPGGGFQLGNGNFDLSDFAAYEDVIAVTFNYRTNIFGFPQSADIPLSNRNLGIHDQRLLFQWVQTNAAAFGGDPEKVTLWGQSAGSLSVDIHLNGYAKANPPPFRAGILSSGQYSFGPTGILPSMSKSIGAQWDQVAKEVGCADQKHGRQLSCMRRVPVSSLLAAQDKFQTNFVPVTDGLAVPSGLGKNWRSGNVAKVPILTGTVQEEGRALLNTKISLETFESVFLSDALTITSTQRASIVDHYRGLPGLATDFDIAAAIYTDFFWHCPQAIFSQAVAALGVPTWRYVFNASIAALLPPQFSYLGKFHASDAILPFFSSPTLVERAVPALTPELYALANHWRGELASFIRNPARGPGWPSVGGAYQPRDVAVVGDLGEEKTSGATPVDRGVVDEKCALYEDVYKFIESLQH